MNILATSQGVIKLTVLDKVGIRLDQHRHQFICQSGCFTPAGSLSNVVKAKVLLDLKVTKLTKNEKLSLFTLIETLYLINFSS